jgi:hypothetical protein
MNKLLSCRQLIVGFIVGFAISSAFAQEWTKKESGRTEYVQDRTEKWPRLSEQHFPEF